MDFHYQLSLFDSKRDKLETDKSKLKILFWNIQNPSFERVKKQLDWIYNLNVDILILTEVKNSKGFYYLKKELEELGYSLIYNISKEYFTVIILRGIKFQKREINLTINSQRVLRVDLETIVGNFVLIGAYLPTNSIEPDKYDIKKRFQDELLIYLKENINKFNSNLIFGGDLNILEPGHKPPYSQFIKWNYFFNVLRNLNLFDIFRHINPNVWEYTWEGNNRHQRLDYIFSTKGMMDFVETCKYIHKPRYEKLSDHSAQLLVLTKEKKF